MRWTPMLLVSLLAACQEGPQERAMTDETQTPPPASVGIADPLAMLTGAQTLDAQERGANAVFSACFQVAMAMRDAATNEPVGFGEDWTDRIGEVVIDVTCDGRTGTFTPLGPEPVFLLMRE